MSIVESVVVYLLLWWWVFFMTLPFGAKPPKETEAGFAESAPQKPRLWRKFGIASFAAAVLWLVVEWLITSGIFSFRDYAQTY